MPSVSLSLPAGLRISAARVGVTGTVQREVRRQNKLFQITIWAATPEIRTGLSKPLGVALAKTQWLDLADNTSGRLIYRSATQSDESERVLIYRNDLFYFCEFATMEIDTATEITQVEMIVKASIAGVQPAQTVADVFA